MVRFVLFFSIMLILSMICITNSLALEGPYYCYTEIETQCGARTDSGQADSVTGTTGALLTPYNLSQVPEPAGILAIMCGIVGLAGFARRRSA